LEIGVARSNLDANAIQTLVYANNYMPLLKNKSQLVLAVTILLHISEMLVQLVYYPSGEKLLVAELWLGSFTPESFAQVLQERTEVAKWNAHLCENHHVYLGPHCAKVGNGVWKFYGSSTKRKSGHFEKFMPAAKVQDWGKNDFSAPTLM
jgi:hypothetical protein